MIYSIRLINLLLLLFISIYSFSQEALSVTDKQKRWQHLDPDYDSVYGISMDRAYNGLLKGRKKKIITVAVIDSGTDTLHEDLRQVLWLNKRELGNDEDRNGYKNDRYGWNFLGSKSGNAIIGPGFEYQRLYLMGKNTCGQYSDSIIMRSEKKNCIEWLSAKAKFKKDSTETVTANLNLWNIMINEDSIWRMALGKNVYTINDLAKCSEMIKEYRYVPSLLSGDPTFTNLQMLASIIESKDKLFKRYSQDPLTHRKEIIGDDYYNISDKFYGNSDINGNDNHGTHVSGIIGAARNNNIGIDGIADAVSLMILKVVPVKADEYDKDVALAIHYAVDNGAKVINMSFGKPYSPEQKWVEKAIKYAARKDVLLVHAAGNDGMNIDSIAVYPTAKYLNGRFAPNVITVGASAASRNELIAPFSNYGKQQVDVFAPGVFIYSTVMENNSSSYAGQSGTSMAAPVVSGLAALLRSYFPKLSSKQIKYIIESSVTKINGFVTRPGKEKQKILMTELCRSGGIVNAYSAIKLADKINERKK